MEKIILFQGDSITDALRDRTRDQFRGHGYATMVTGTLGAAQPGQYQFLNRGISGNRIVDLYARIRGDMINLKPDYISILIGINSVWHGYSNDNGVDAEKFEMVYNLMIDELKQALPGVKIMLLEPFMLPGTATEDTPEKPERWAYFSKEVPLRQAAVRRVAEKQNALFVPLQEKFDRLNVNVPKDYWLFDGVHPTAAGHELIKQAWLEGFSKL